MSDAAPIRRATWDDARAIFELSAEMAVTYVVEWDAFQQSLASLLNTPAAHLLVVATVGEQPQGYLLGFTHPTFFANGPVGWVEELAVRQDCRRRGLGSTLMAAFENIAHAGGCRITALATRRAASFYEALGYSAGADYFRKTL